MSRPKIIDQYVYRLALYGVRSSGKTCILSALSLPRFAHPDGLSCSWIENVPGHELPPGDPSSWETHDPYHVGWRWLSEQRKRIADGNIPAPNPNREPMRFRFDFGSPEYGTRHVELVDYSGELVTASASELAAALRDHMRDCNGLLILAEVPRADGDQRPLTEDLTKLSGAFQSLLSERGENPRQEWPIALLFNKWDRRTTGGDKQQSAQELLAGFLTQTPAPPHLALVNTIRNAVGDDNVSNFPVSAFGDHEYRNDGAEVPCLSDGQLQSYGLEDGFLWVTQRHDSLKVDQLEQVAEAASWWAFHQLLTGTTETAIPIKRSCWKQWLRGISTSSGVSSAWKLRHRFPKNSPLRKRTERALRRFSMKLAIQLSVFVACLAVGWLGYNYMQIDSRYHGILAIQSNPAANSAEMESSEKWLENYFASSGPLHWIFTKIALSKEDAQHQLFKMRTKRDETAWQPVQRTLDELTKSRLSKQYLESFPSGNHQSEANVIVAEARRREGERLNLEHLQRVAHKIEAFVPKPDGSVDELHQFRESIDSIPYTDSRTASIESTQSVLRKNVSAKQNLAVEAAATADWQKSRQTYLSLMPGDVSGAARLLNRLDASSKEHSQLIDDFIKRAPQIIKDNVSQAIVGRYWKSARDHAAMIDDLNVKRLLPASIIKEIETVRDDIDVAHDKYMYGQILARKPQCADQVASYLSDAPLKTMQKYVENYSVYLAGIAKELPLKLTVAEMEWDTEYGGKIYNYRNEIKVVAKGKTVITIPGIVHKAGTVDKQLGGGSITAKVNESIMIDVSVQAKYGLLRDGDTSGGEGKWAGTIRQLRDGVSIDLNGDGFKNVIRLAIHGFPQEPTLPQWKSR